MTASAFNPCIVIPVFNHPTGISNTLAKLQPLGHPVIVVDDGCEPACRTIIEHLEQQYDHVDVQYHQRNQGKGAAIKTGLRRAAQLGYSHALQIDADEQHDAGEIPAMLGHSQSQPDAVILGTPVYDASVPRSRYWARYLTHVWVWINTLSRQTPDAMCGFRVYPVSRTVALLDRNSTGDRMQFDIELVVKLSWQRVRLLPHPVQVSYPADGTSHFHYLRDNWNISLMHARLFFGMLWRLPFLLAGKSRHD